MTKNYRSYFNTFVLHFRPRTVTDRTLRFNLTFGLGGSAAVLIFLLFSTGLLLKFAYEPHPTVAYESIVSLQYEVPFGGLIRNIHHWSANLLLVVAFLHLLRVFFTGAFHAPRRLNWVIGLGMLCLVVMSNITGYLLPWDQLAFWAITIVTGMLEYVPLIGLWLQEMVRGGAEMGPDTMSNFFALHTAVLPILLIALMPFHFWRIRKARGLVVLRSPDEDADVTGQRVETIPNLLLREIVMALVVVAGIMLFSVIVDAPLLAKANPGLSPNPTRAPWYFAGMQEMLLHFHPSFSLFAIPLLVTAGLFCMPYFRFQGTAPGVWLISHKGRRMAAVATVVALIVTPLGILASQYLLQPGGLLQELPSIIGTGVIPFSAVLAVVVGFTLIMRRKYSATSAETIQTTFVLLLVIFAILTLTNVFLRGEGMRLIWQ
jgi:quinol-cytochrome oxidoreductase complex cytochrome b subunit